MNDSIPEWDVLYIYAQILLAPKYMHRSNLIHSDFIVAM